MREASKSPLVRRSAEHPPDAERSGRKRYGRSVIASPIWAPLSGGIQTTGARGSHAKGSATSSLRTAGSGHRVPDPQPCLQLMGLPHGSADQPERHVKANRVTPGPSSAEVVRIQGLTGLRDVRGELA